MAGPWEAYQTLPDANLAQNDAPPIATPRAVVPSTSRVWGDQEAQSAGLYETSGGDPWAQFKKKEPPSANNSFAGRVAENKPDVGQGRALLEGALSGASANFRDEIYGASKASGLPDWLGGFRSPVGAARLIYEQATGQPGEATAEYKRAIAYIRDLQKTAQEQYPITSMVGEVGGAIALPVGGMLQAATLPARMARGATVGAVYGGLSGAGRGENLEDRASQSAVGTALGGVVGALAPPLIEGAVRGATALASTPINMIRGAVNPERAAERSIGRAYREALDTDPGAAQRLTPQEIGQGPGIILDVLGGEGRNLARSAANLSGGARDTLNKTLDDRFETQSNRFVNWLNNRFNYPNAHTQQQAIDHVEQTVNKAAYRRAHVEGNRPIWSPEIERLVGSDAVQNAIRRVVSTGKDRAINDGYGGFRSPVTVTNDGQLVFNKGPSGVPTYPNLQFWDYVRREISNEASKAERAGAKEDAGRLWPLARALNAELDRLVPSYQNARRGAARFFGAENALEAGQKFVAENFAIPRAREALARMSFTERQLFQDGFVSRYIDTINQVPDRADVVRRIYNSPAAREKIDLVLGHQRANELEAMVRVETIMQMGLRAVQGNSTTTMQILGSGLAGATGGGVLGFDPTYSGLATALMTAGKRGIDARVAQRVAEMLTSDNPAVLNRGIKMVANNKTLMQALRLIDSAGSRVGGQQVPTNFVGPSMPAIGRADDQPQIPRPPGQ